ncbi:MULTISPECIES: DUF881 domain-containing protein [Nocardioides]|uniref:DUF881 domain-containing protein n=1 Tax=Nocardioides vastitatis TaxID=2568655 RepID=A0ABW0ZI53_9ACTN|nr:DUF881 domain-containing protein [Nocardioides sp.]THJ05507.1 DUF881 domain-containing protein [Nocardioides sp.]
MTGAHSGGPTGRRSSRSLAWRVGTPVVALLSGALMAVSATNSDGADLRPGRYTDLATLVEGEAASYEEIEERYKELAAEVDRLGGDVSDEGVDRARGEVAELSDPAGLTPRKGPGVRITLFDSPAELLQEAVEHNKDLDGDEEPINLQRFVVHQQDIQAVVNALWTGGATAVTIEGQRVISTTGIKCEGPVVQLQGVPYPQPYEIEAVGDQTALMAALQADSLVSGYRNDAADPTYAIGWTMELQDEIDAPAYDGVVDVQYAEPLR